MKREYNSFLTYWPWLLPIGLVIGGAGLGLKAAGVLTDYWAGFAIGFGAVLALVGLGMLITRLCRGRK